MAANPNSILGITIERNPPKKRLQELNVKQWSKSEAEPGKSHAFYFAEEICYYLKGKMRVYPNPSESSSSSSSSSSEFLEFGAGDLVTFPKGMSCIYEVSVAVEKYVM